VLEAIQYLDATVARVLGIPPTWLNTQALSSLTYSTSRDESKRFINTTLRTSYLTRIEAAMSQYLPRGQVAMFDTSGLTRLDVDAQVQVDADLIAAGIMTVDEIRAQRGLEPIATPTPTEVPNV
jgi:phage portal protein BeeE